MTVIDTRVVSSDMSPAEMRVLTDRIRSLLDESLQLLLGIYESQAWTVLGYTTWKSYIDTEFGFSESHSFQMLRKARLDRAAQVALGPVPDSDASLSEPTPVEPRFSFRAVRAFRDEEPEEVVAEIAEEVQGGVSFDEALKTVAARRAPNRYPPVSEQHVPVPPLKDVRAELRDVMAQVRAVLDSAPDAGRGDTAQADELCQWVTILSILTGRTDAGDELFGRIYRLRAEAFEHLLTLGESREALSHLSGIKVVTVNYWLGHRRAGTIRVPHADE